MAHDDSTPGPPTPLGIDPIASRRIFLMMLTLAAGGFLAYRFAADRAGPPPAAIANDPLLVRGRSIYLARCASCHGLEGRGDGPIARNLAGPRVGNFTDSTWKHGDRPDQVVEVVARGAPATAMSAWGGILDPPDLRAVSAFVFHLAGKPIPSAFRIP